MATLPSNDVSIEDLVEWDRLKKELAKVKALEMTLRTKIFKGYFPNPIEGTNSAPLANDYQLKGKYVISREVDPGALSSLVATLRENNIRTEELINYKPNLVLSEYRKLTAEEMKLFDQVLIIKPGSPALEITAPAKPKAKAK